MFDTSSTWKKLQSGKCKRVAVADPPWSPVIPLCFGPARLNGFIFLFGFNAKSYPDREPFKSKQMRIQPIIIMPTRAWSPKEGVQWQYLWRHNRDATAARDRRNLPSVSRTIGGTINNKRGITESLGGAIKPSCDARFTFLFTVVIKTIGSQ